MTKDYIPALIFTATILMRFFLSRLIENTRTSILTGLPNRAVGFLSMGVMRLDPNVFSLPESHIEVWAPAAVIRLIKLLCLRTQNTISPLIRLAARKVARRESPHVS